MAEMTIKQKARVAWEKGGEVKVEFKQPGLEKAIMTGTISAFAPAVRLSYPDGGYDNISYEYIAGICFVDESGEEAQDEHVAIGQFAYTEPGAGRKVVGLICDSALVNSEGKLVVRTCWPGEDHIAGMTGRLDMDFAESIFGYHGMAIVYEVLMRGGYADITFTIDDPQESREASEKELLELQRKIDQLEAENAELKRALDKQARGERPWAEWRSDVEIEAMRRIKGWLLNRIGRSDGDRRC